MRSDPEFQSRSMVRFIAGLISAGVLILCPGCQLTDAQLTPTDAQTDSDPVPRSAGPTHQFSEHMMTLIPAGTFEMGSSAETVPLKYRKCEMPPHQVSIPRPFWMCQTETTVSQFRRFVEETGFVTEAEQDQTGCNRLDLNTGKVIQDPAVTWRTPGFPQSDRHPVVGVSHRDALAYCRWLTNKHGHSFRLPTEAEWEYACRAGTTTAFSSGHRPKDLQGFANASDQSLKHVFSRASGSAPWDDGHPFTAPVASYQPNRFGMYDMHGNVGEWCADWFAPDSYSQQYAQERRPRKWRVVRGGSWFNNALSCRSSGRHDGIETAASQTNGFRIVMDDSQPGE